MECVYCGRKAASSCAQIRKPICRRCSVQKDGIKFSNIQAMEKFFQNNHHDSMFRTPY